LRNFDAIGKALKTNVPSNTAFRGFGGPEGAVIIEEIIAKMAHVSGLTSIKIKEVIHAFFFSRLTFQIKI
jgi:xanthine dehydrogenase molybdopterin-binding subunit B